MKEIFFDKFLLALLTVVILAYFFPLQGTVELGFTYATKLAIGVLFFLHGARLSCDSLKLGLGHWRLHLVVLACTFLLFPLLGGGAIMLVGNLKHSPFYIGMLYLCILPSTVQSSIAFTSLARGNVAAAIVSASASNILGIFITPLLVGLLLSANLGGTLFSFDIFWSILIQLFMPFIVGQLFQPWWGKFLHRQKNLIALVDRGSILMVVFLASSEAVNAHIWHIVSGADLIAILIFDVVLLGLVLAVSWFGAKWLGFDRADCITIMFCGSKKSLASGAPMANVIFSQSSLSAIIPNVGMIILPVMLFHQIQLMVCTLIARYLVSAREKPLGFKRGEDER